MVKHSTRAKRQKAARMPARKTAHIKAGKKKMISHAEESISHFRKTHWSIYQNLQKRADRAWEKLHADVKRKASPHVLMEDRNNLLLLLGECNYMAGECLRTGAKRRV